MSERARGFKSIPISEWYKNRLVIDKILLYMQANWVSLQQTTLQEFREYIQNSIDDEWEEI